MADMPTKEDVDALREMAANRGCRLVRSRRRKPGGDYGRFGVADAKSGKEVFGFGKSGLQASAGEIETFLRGSSASTWKKSLGTAGKAAGTPPAEAKRKARSEPKRSRPAAASAPSRPARAAREPDKPKAAKVEPPAQPALRIRRADSVDGEAIAALLGALGEHVESDAIADRIAGFSRAGAPVLLAKLGDEVVGCVTWQAIPVLHRSDPVGRITLLAVAVRARRQGIGTELLRAAERKLAERGCRQVEIAAAGKSAAARKFCRALGYEPAADLFARAIGT